MATHDHPSLPRPAGHDQEISDSGSLRTLFHQDSHHGPPSARSTSQATREPSLDQAQNDEKKKKEKNTFPWGQGPKVMFTECKSAPPTAESPLALPGPFPLRNSRMRFVFASLDGLLALIAVAFVVFGFLVLANDGGANAPGTLGRRLLEASSYGPTIFPMLFAAIVGRMLKAVATLLAQEGSTFGRIEQLLGSATIFGTVATQFQLGAFDLVSVTLLLSWACSPLGSQGALRVIYPGRSTVETAARVTAFSIEPQNFTGFQAGTERFEYEGKPSFSTAMLFSTSEKGARTQDNWGNLRVPMASADAPRHPTAGGQQQQQPQPGAWAQLSSPSDANYSSLAGFPITLSTSVSDGGGGGAAATGAANASFILDRLPYLSLDCPVFELSTSGGFTRASAQPLNATTPWAAWEMGNFSGGNAAGGGPGQAQIGISICEEEKGATSASQAGRVCPGPPAARPPRRLLWESIVYMEPSAASAVDWGVARAECEMRTSHVDVEYACDDRGGACEARRVRVSAAADDDRRTFFDDAPGRARGLVAMLTSLFSIPRPRQNGFADQLHPVVGYLVSPANATSQALFEADSSVLRPGRAAFETRMAQLLNTMYMFSASPVGRDGGGGGGVNPLGAGVGDRFEWGQVVTRTAGAALAADREVVLCSRPWLAVLLASCLGLLGAALASMVIRSRLVAPDVLGSLSVAALENRFCRGGGDGDGDGDAVVSGGTTLDGMERARLMRHVPVRISDVNPEGASGRIALAGPADGASLCAPETGRLYE